MMFVAMKINFISKTIKIFIIMFLMLNSRIDSLLYLWNEKMFQQFNYQNLYTSILYFSKIRSKSIRDFRLLTRKDKRRNLNWKKC